MKPMRAVNMKFEEVLRMETWVVPGPRERAFVKRAHIMALKRRLRRKNICEEAGQFVNSEKGKAQGEDVDHAEDLSCMRATYSSD